MLSIKLANGRRARAIVVDKPINGLSGIVECSHCDCRVGLYETEPDEIASEIEKFINGHIEQFNEAGKEVSKLTKVKGLIIHKMHP